jgi:hypothetical protein
MAGVMITVHRRLMRIVRRLSKMSEVTGLTGSDLSVHRLWCGFFRIQVQAHTQQGGCFFQCVRGSCPEIASQGNDFTGAFFTGDNDRRLDVGQGPVEIAFAVFDLVRG